MSFTGKATYSAGSTLPELAEDVSDAVVEFNGDLYLLDIEEALAPLTLEETLKCR